MSSMKNAQLVNNKIEIQLTKKDIRRTVPQLHKIKDLTYNKQTEEYKCNNTIENITILHDSGFRLDLNLSREYILSQPNEWRNTEVPNGYNGLWEHQIEALKFIKYHNGRALLSIIMGGGKTATALSYAKMEGITKILVICPSIVKSGWKEEKKQWLEAEVDAQVIAGRSKVKIEKDVVIINYDIIDAHVDNLLKYGFELIIIDECQVIKNNGEKEKHTEDDGTVFYTHSGVRYRACKKIANKTSKIIALSGTPIINRSAEFFNILNILRPNVFRKRSDFLDRYCDPKFDGFAWNYKGCSNERELNRILQHIMFRRSVVRGVTQAILTPIITDDTSIENYENYCTKIDHIPMSDQAKFEKKMIKSYELKKKQVYAFIDNVLENGEKVVVFAIHKKIVNDIQKHYKSVAVKINGEVSPKQKEINKNAFINDPQIKILTANIESAGTGLDGLHKVCSKGVMLEYPYSPKVFDQVTGRLCRINGSAIVNFYCFILRGAPEELFFRILDRKRKAIDKVVDNALTPDELLLIEQMKKYGK